jgi:uncharacterized repeat protein (TIGR03809 family)
MPLPRSFLRLAELARRWCDLAERRLAHLAELHCSGRWRHYYSEVRLLARLQETARIVELWADIVAQLSECEKSSAPADPDERAAA